MSRQKVPVNGDLSFPVLEERSLLLIPRKFLRGARRDLGDLPKAHPGSVLVFRHGSRYVAFGEDKPLTGAEEPVVDATAVCLVDTRTRYFTVQFPLPSKSPADDFTVRATFQARVTVPERAAEEGAVNMTRYLASYLERDPRLSKLGSEHPVEDIAMVRDLVISRLEAYCEYNPIHLPGLSVTLSSAGVLTPHDLRVQAQEERNAYWQHRVEAIRAKGEDWNIERIKKLVNEGTQALTALGLARNETSVDQAIDHAREDDKRHEEQLAEAIRILQRNGDLDFLGINPDQIVASWLEKITGQPLQLPDRADRSVSGGGRRSAIGTAADDEDDEPPDEADLDG